MRRTRLLGAVVATAIAAFGMAWIAPAAQSALVGSTVARGNFPIGVWVEEDRTVWVLTLPEPVDTLPSVEDAVPPTTLADAADEVRASVVSALETTLPSEAGGIVEAVDDPPEPRRVDGRADLAAARQAKE